MAACLIMMSHFQTNQKQLYYIYIYTIIIYIYNIVIMIIYSCFRRSCGTDQLLVLVVCDNRLAKVDGAVYDRLFLLPLQDACKVTRSKVILTCRTQGQRSFYHTTVARQQCHATTAHFCQSKHQHE